jgi:sulfite reductase beta subunit-like hemoprotein
MATSAGILSTHGPSTYGPADLHFSSAADVADFVATLERFESGEIDADAWRAYRLLNGTYGQRQEGELSMLRAKLPQGRVSAAQLEVIADVADVYSRGFAHITTRQNFQFHFVRLSRMGEAMAKLADAGITTREACGNSVRNVTASPTAGVAADEVFDVTPYARALTRHFLRTPIATTLPRKFKIAFSGGGHDHSFVGVNDIGFTARLDAEGHRRFQVTIGGGTALMCQGGSLFDESLAEDHILALTEAVLRVYSARGDRVHRKKNRLKFLIKQLGWPTFEAAVRDELAKVLEEGHAKLVLTDEDRAGEQPPEPSGRRLARADIEALTAGESVRGPGITPSYLPTVGGGSFERFVATNVRPQRQAGYSIVTVVAPLGDLSSARLRVIAALARAFSDGTVRLTAHQNVVLRWVRSEDVAALHELLRVAGLASTDPHSLADVASCPGAESCKLAVTQSRGLADRLAQHFADKTEELEISTALAVRVSGCPNGCGLHHVAGIGLQGGLRKVEGRAVPQYHVTVGASIEGGAPTFGRLLGKIPARRVPLMFERLIGLYRGGRRESESMTAYLARTPLPELRAAIADLEKLEAHDANPEDFVDLGESSAFAPSTTEGECAA